MTVEGFLMLLLIVIGLGGFALCRRLNIYRMNRRARRNGPERPPDGSKDD
jgi:hypothetical protein